MIGHCNTLWAAKGLSSAQHHKAHTMPGAFGHCTRCASLEPRAHLPKCLPAWCTQAITTTKTLLTLTMLTQQDNSQRHIRLAFAAASYLSPCLPPPQHWRRLYARRLPRCHSFLPPVRLPCCLHRAHPQGMHLPPPPRSPSAWRQAGWRQLAAAPAHAPATSHAVTNRCARCRATQTSE